MVRIVFLSIVFLLTALPAFAASSDYVALSHLRIYERPNDHSRIIADLPRFRLLTVEPIDQAWAKVLAVGTERFGRCLVDGGEMKDGVYVQPMYREYRECGDEILPQHGFVQLSVIAPVIQDAAPVPLPSGGYRDVRQYWTSWGITDNRKQVVDLDRHPYNAIVGILKQGHERPATFGELNFGTMGEGQVCSGAFAYSDTVVVTAGHCITDEQAPITVRIERGRDRYEDITARVIRLVFIHGAEDWAVLRLDRKPRLPVEPLQFAEKVDWSRVVVYRPLVVGYPSDLFNESRTFLGFHAPALEACIDIWPSAVDNTEADGKSLGLIRSECPAFTGNSGGPLLVWQVETHTFAIVGVLDSITSVGAGEKGKNLSLFNVNLSEQEKQRIESKVREIYSVGRDNNKTVNYMVTKETFFVPGYSKVLHAYLGVKKYNSRVSLSRELVEIVRTTAGFPELGDHYWNDRRYMGFFSLQSNKRVGIPGSLRRLDFKEGRGEKQFILNDVVEIRKQCAAACDRESLDFRRQQSWAYGDTVDRAVIKDLVQSKKAGFVTFRARYHDFHETEDLQRKTELEKSKFLATLVETNSSQVLHLITGGDLFVIDREDLSVIGIQRNIMNLRRKGLPFNESFSQRYAPRDPATGQRRKLDEHDGVGEDFGVEATTTLRSENFGSPTPLTILGGTLIGTRELHDKLRSKTPPTVIAAMNDPYSLPGAIALDYAGNGGAFNDATQTKLATALKEFTGGDKRKEVVIYCHHSRCWLSYNAMLRVAQLGYTNLRWYRGGIEAWIDAGLELDEASPREARGN